MSNSSDSDQTVQAVRLQNTQVLGRFKLCINTYRIDGREMAETEVVPIDMPDSNGEMTWQAKNYTQYSSYFMKITCLK